MAIWLLAIPALIGLSMIPGCTKVDPSPDPKPKDKPKNDPSSTPPSGQDSAYLSPEAFLKPLEFNGRSIVPKAGGFLRTRVELEGDPKLGTVFYLRNYHTAGFGRMRQQGIQDYQSFLIASQWKALQMLEQLGTYDIFSERVDKLTTGQDFLNELKSHSRGRETLPAIEVLKEIEAEYPPYGMGLLNVDIGAPYTYAIRHPQVRLHPVFTTEQRKQSQQALKDRKSDAYRQNMTDREAWATDEMIKFLKANPGKSIVLVFGGAHEFCDNFTAQNFKPRMVSAWFEFPRKFSLWSDSPPVRIDPEWNINTVRDPLPKCP